MTIKNSIRFLVILALAGFLITSEVASPQEAERPGVLAQVVTTTDPMLQEINRIRAEAGLPSLVEDQRLSLSAGAKARDLAERDYWSHDTPDGQSFSELVYEYSPDVSAVGENLAKCYNDPVPAWVASQSHYENMLGNWTYWGGGSATGNECNYIVNHFSK